jgi:thiamine-phosphate pyrophosphorylase|tara:strand:+ start:2804 stop:3379 length:576 start_codon:yes stop_codon:yes gene_type:complete
MFIFKKKYYLFLENTRSFNLDLVKTRYKLVIIYRNEDSKESIAQIKNYAKLCRRKGIKFFIANNTLMLTKVKADGLYISAHNKDLSLIRYKHFFYEIIGSAHNHKEIVIKLKQGCQKILVSRLFQTSYLSKKGFLGITKFNTIAKRTPVEIIPLGGININNLSKLKMVKSNSIAFLSAIKKKPAKFINRLF